MNPIDPKHSGGASEHEPAEEASRPDAGPGKPHQKAESENAMQAERAEAANKAAAPSETAEEPSDALKEQMEQLTADRDAHYERSLRLQAELENYRKRVQREAEQNRLYQMLPLVRDLLPGLDNLQRALAAAESSKNVDELVQGVQLVLKQFEDVLGQYAVRQIDAAGHPFDPNLHEAVQQIPSEEHPAMTVLQELERGYTLNDRVVRPSKVIVSSGPPSE